MLCWHNRGWLCIFQQHQFMGWLLSGLSVPHGAVTYNYSPLHGDSAMDSNLEGHSWNHQCAAVILVITRHQADRTGQRPNNRILKLSSRLMFEEVKLYCRVLHIDAKHLSYFYVYFKDIHTHACIARGQKRVVKHVVQEIKLQASPPSYICITSQQ